MKLMIALAAFGLVGAAAPEAEPGRLPPGVTPVHYDLVITPDAKALSFAGEETIAIDVAAPAAALTLNAADLKIAAANVDGAPVAAIRPDEAAQTVTFALSAPLAAGRHRLAIRWSGKINENAAGLFAIDYTDARGPQRMLATQFEPADARRFMPSWDQPDLKATFTLTAITPKGETAFSNMPVAAAVPAGADRVAVTFALTPKMSDYLLFLGIGDVERVTTRVGPTEIGVITRRGAAGQGRYALASAARILTYYNAYFGTPYPLPKLDMIAGPGSSQFFGAMENWGAIFYFERDLLLDPRLATEGDREGVFSTVAHEMAHQWFGDLVTMRWWDDIWLNEGFASWMADKVSNDLNPDWHVTARSVAFSRQSAFSLDSRTGTHPIVQHVATPAQVDQAFDTITYSKGQQVIRMLEGAVGPDAFRDGVRRYMARHAYGNTATDDLWAEIAVAAHRPVKPLMDAFTLQEGVPLIRASEPRCAGGRATLALAQDRFATDDSARAPRIWPVPVNLAGGAAGAQVEVGGSAEHPVALSGCGRIVVNPGQFGYYRTLLAPGHFTALAGELAKLPLEDQIGLLQDRIYLANAGYVPLTGVLGLVDRLPATADPLMWQVVAGRMQAYDDLLEGDSLRPAFRARALRLLHPQFAQVGFAARPDEPPAVSRLREVLIEALGQLGDPEVVAGARRLVAGGLDHIPASIREAVTGVYARNVDTAGWEELRRAAKADTSPLVKESLYGQLGSAGDVALAQRTLDLALTDEASVPNRATLISGVAQEHPALAFDWAVAHAARVNALIEASARLQFIPRLAAAGNDPGLADRVAAFAERAIPANERRSAQLIVANIRYSAGVKARVHAPLAAWTAGAGAG